MAHSVYWNGTAAFFDGKEARERIVAVAIRTDGLEILNGEAAGLHVRNDISLFDGHGDGFFRLELKSFPGSILEFRDRDAFRWMETVGLLGRRPFSGFSLAEKLSALLVLLFTLFIFIYFVGLDLAVKTVVEIIPAKIDRMLGQAVVKTFREKTLMPKDSLATRALEKSALAIMAINGLSGDSIRILVIADTSVKNAFAFPGGYILVYTGMLHMLDDQEEWLGLLAHEGGHVALRHGMRSVVRGSFLAIAATLVFGDVSGLSAAILDNAGTLVSRNYNRKDEAAADEYARAHLEAAGHSSEGMSRLFGKLLALEKQPKWAVFLSTHPATEDRIARLKDAQRDTRKNTQKDARMDAGKIAAAGHSKTILTAEEWAALKGL
jgi:Zn-dependent protease with chaperone function